MPNEAWHATRNFAPISTQTPHQRRVHAYRRSTEKMKRGIELMRWNEPRAWLDAAKSAARSEGKSVFPRRNWFMVMILIGGIVVYEWSKADPERRVAPMSLVLILILLFAALTGLVWSSILLRSTVTSLHDNGIFHGPRFSRRWTPFSSIEIFYIEEEEFRGRRFRFLNWQEDGLEEESYAVIPGDVDTSAIVTLLESKVQQARAPNP